MEATTNSFDRDRVLCECSLEPLRDLVLRIEQAHEISISRPPLACLTMIPAEDSLEKQKFYLGEALTTECEVLVDQKPGYGLCLGDEPIRTYCIAVIDGLVHNEIKSSLSQAIDGFVHEQGELLAKLQQEEFDLILQTSVDFKLMEEQ